MKARLWPQSFETHRVPRRSSGRGDKNGYDTVGLGLLDLFAQHFKLQPLVFSSFKVLLRRGERGRTQIEFLAILLVEVGIVKMTLLLGDFRLQPGDGLRQGVQRVLLIEIELALRSGRGRAAPRV